ncbi:unnamed protein product [Caenorhabditis angaria]|uniref:Uncharacterized protein n=1 Tax=Caenorhabditis angaria TaxID=860376 RepID=A0A9P1N2Q8_9PELO|nr:unnamed protein product [Caenorhabditis angaria]
MSRHPALFGNRLDPHTLEVFQLWCRQFPSNEPDTNDESEEEQDEEEEEEDVEVEDIDKECQDVVEKLLQDVGEYEQEEQEDVEVEDIDKECQDVVEKLLQDVGEYEEEVQFKNIIEKQCSTKAEEELLNLSYDESQILDDEEDEDEEDEDEDEDDDRMPTASTTEPLAMVLCEFNQNKDKFTFSRIAGESTPVVSSESNIAFSNLFNNISCASVPQIFGRRISSAETQNGFEVDDASSQSSNPIMQDCQVETEFFGRSIEVQTESNTTDEISSQTDGTILISRQVQTDSINIAISDVQTDKIEKDCATSTENTDYCGPVVKVFTEFVDVLKTKLFDEGLLEIKKELAENKATIETLKKQISEMPKIQAISGEEDKVEEEDEDTQEEFDFGNMPSVEKFNKMKIYFEKYYQENLKGKSPEPSERLRQLSFRAGKRAIVDDSSIINKKMRKATEKEAETLENPEQDENQNEKEKGQRCIKKVTIESEASTSSAEAQPILDANSNETQDATTSSLFAPKQQQQKTRKNSRK